MKQMKTWHKISFIIATILALASLAIAIYYWGKLPGTIPVHFGISGQPDRFEGKSLFYVFLIPVLQLVMLGGFMFLYAKPQYSDMPTTLLLMGMEKSHRDHAFELIRTMLVVVIVWMGVLFTYLTYIMNASAMNNLIEPSPWIMGGLIVGLLVWLIYYTVKVYRYTKTFLEKK